MKRVWKCVRSLWQETSGAVFVEYLLLLTIVGIGLIAGLCVVRDALTAELQDLADAIAAITI
jgi:Flp pilus assembly pilin Flp